MNRRGGWRRSDDTSEDAETRAACAFHLRRDGLRAFYKQRPRLDFAKLRDRLCAVRIVKIQDRSLREHVRRAKTRRMIGVAFNFRRPPFVAFHEQSDRVRANRHRRGIKLRLPEGPPTSRVD